MMGLEGTDFSPEDVIGDDLRKMDAQIASFQRRIDGTASDWADVAGAVAVGCGRGGSGDGRMWQGCGDGWMWQERCMAEDVVI